MRRYVTAFYFNWITRQNIWDRISESGFYEWHFRYGNGINGNFMKTKGTPADCKFMVSRCFFYLFSEIYLRISFFFIRLTYWRDSFSFRAIWASLLS